MQLIDFFCSNADRHQGLQHVLKAYGIFPIQSEHDDDAGLLLLEGDPDKAAEKAREACAKGRDVIWISPPPEEASQFGVTVQPTPLPSIAFPILHPQTREMPVAASARYGLRSICSGGHFTCTTALPILRNTQNQYEAILQNYKKGRILWIGPNILDEIVRYRHGDPSLPTPEIDYDLNACTCERPQYRFLNQLAQTRKHLPEADLWGWWLAGAIKWLLPEVPWICPLPSGASIALLISGDEDECHSELIDSLAATTSKSAVPYTLFTTRTTNLDGTQLSKLAESGFQYALHPVVQSTPEDYVQELRGQINDFHDKFEAPPSSVRNHMHLHSGYMDFHKIWEEAGLCMEFNYPGADGTVLNGSYLPLNSCLNGKWLSLQSCITLFSDYVFQTETTHAQKRFSQTLAAMRSGLPGYFTCNFHPFNIKQSRKAIRWLAKQTRKKDCIALGVNDLLSFQAKRDSIEIVRTAPGLYEFTQNDTDIPIAFCSSTPIHCEYLFRRGLLKRPDRSIFITKKKTPKQFRIKTLA